MKTSKAVTLIIVLLAIVAAIAYLEMGKAGPTGSGVPVGGDNVTVATSTTATTSPSRAALIAQKAAQYPMAKEFVDPTGFVNTPGGLPITLSQYIGKDVVLLDFWTYSCINCQRTLPYLTTWYSKYEGHGFVIIGIHTPEFDFEKDINNVQMAADKFGIKYPVVLDSDYGTWDAYGNLYWPREYLIDIDGFIREDHIGEGGYSDTETMIQQLLKERDQELGITDDSIPTSLVTNPAPQMTTISDETYFGAFRNQTFGNGTPGLAGVQTFTLPSTFSQDTFYLGGTWNMQQQYAESDGQDTIVFPYTSKYVYVVASSTVPVDVTVKVDGKVANTVSVSTAQLYTLVSQPDVESHTLELDIPRGGVDIFTLTFGS